MEKFAQMLIRRRKAVIALFVAAVVVCALLFLTVQVNYSLVDYLPPEAQSTIALEVMKSEFAGALPNANVEVPGVSLMEALALKNEFKAIPHVTEVLWLDDVADLAMPLEMGDKDLIETYYKDGSARFSLVIEDGFEQAAISEIRKLVGESGIITGEAATREFVQSAVSSEVLSAVIIVVPLVFLILCLSTTSWLEPLLFFAAIGVSIVINMGTNAIFGEVSFLTNSVTPILQLAVSLDYAIFLLHSFGAHRKAGVDVDSAMRMAVKESFSSISGSACTTLFGFMALMFMDFRLGADLGLSLAKGIIFSFIAVVVFLPALVVCTHKAIEKTQHKEFLPAFANVHSVFRRVAPFFAIIVMLIVVPCFLGQSRTDFLYGYEASGKESTDSADAETVWQDSPVMVLLVPRGDVAREEMLCDEISALPYVTSLMSYASTVGSGIPPEFLDASITEQFYSENLARIILYLDTPNEGDEAFAAVEEIKAIAENYYPASTYESTYALGMSANLYDIKTVVQNDNRLVTLIAIASIFVVLLVIFKSALLPLFLIFTIQVAIWINLAIPYFMGTSVNYVGYLVLNTVQLGATVDYAILLTVTYMRNRRELDKKEAMHKTLGTSFRSILVSAATLSTAGFVLAATSSNPIIKDIGTLLGRGTILSMLMVVVFLPLMLTTFDKAIAKTTLGIKP